MSLEAQKRRQQYLKRLQRFKTERSRWDPTWMDLSDYVQPRKARFFSHDANNGMKKESHIINNTATIALGRLAAGMLAGITSPARPWIRMTTFDPDLSEFDPVKVWLDLLGQRILGVLARTNLYNVFHGKYEDLGQFGVSASLLEEDAKTVVRAYPQPIGEFYLATDERGEVDTLYRRLQMSVRQLVRQFADKGSPTPLSNLSTRVRNLYTEGNYDEWIDVVHIVEPREEYDDSRATADNKPIASCWFEEGGDEGLSFLRESGYDENPLIAPRWNVLGEDIYGSSPGMVALGDVKQLQLYERRKDQAVERIVDPPLQGPTTLQGAGGVDMRPGRITYVEPGAHGAKIEPTVIVNPQAITVAVASIQECERRINQAFGADLWLMMSQGDGEPQKTAREIAERHEEKMLQLGPVMERLETELLDKVVSRVYGILLRDGMLPPPPKELQGQDLRVEYLSIMAQAQRMVAGSAMQQLSAFALQFATAKPEVLDKLNGDEMVIEMADALGLPPKVLETDQQVQAIRQQRAQAQAQQQQAAQAAAMAKGAKDLSGADMSGNNALTQLVGPLAAAQTGSES